MLAGDFNVHNGPWRGSSKTTRAEEYFEEICAVHGLAQHVKTATRGNNPLDLILSNLGDRVSVDVTSPIGRSDHSVLLTKIATCPQREKRTSRRVWRYSKADWGRLGKFYHDVEWSKIISSDPNLACKGVTETILDGMHRHTPNKRLTTRPSDPSWWTPECTATVQVKRRSWDRLHKYPSRRARTCTRRIVLGALHAFTMQRNVDWPLFDNALKADRCKTSSGGQPLKLLVVMGAVLPNLTPPRIWPPPVKLGKRGLPDLASPCQIRQAASA